MHFNIFYSVAVVFLFLKYWYATCVTMFLRFNVIFIVRVSCESLCFAIDYVKEKSSQHYKEIHTRVIGGSEDKKREGPKC